MRIIEAFCPNCQWREVCQTDSEALQKANEHNASCAEQRKGFKRIDRWQQYDRKEPGQYV